MESQSRWASGACSDTNASLICLKTVLDPCRLMQEGKTRDSGATDVPRLHPPTKNVVGPATLALLVVGMLVWTAFVSVATLLFALVLAAPAAACYS